MKFKILIVDDEPAIRKFLRASLSAEESKVIECETANEALKLVATENPDVILLDLGLPDMDGKRVLEQIRKQSRTPIIVLSARDQEEDKVEALDLGADDYLTKPFTIKELEARIRVSLRHHRPQQEEATLKLDDVEVDLLKRKVTKNGTEVHLTPLEFKLLAHLIKHSDKVVTHRQILTEVWGSAYAKQTQYLRVFMGQLRQKLESDPAQPRFLSTEPGIGYRLRTSLN